ncbi:MAG TPA: hypothetical protein VFO36_01805, partial [Nitrospiraceae bacterium]|nr:hypothetical protein [Nitrospiraceae bacterium]
MNKAVGNVKKNGPELMSGLPSLNSMPGVPSVQCDDRYHEAVIGCIIERSSNTNPAKLRSITQLRRSASVAGGGMAK